MEIDIDIRFFQVNSFGESLQNPAYFYEVEETSNGNKDIYIRYKNYSVVIKSFLQIGEEILKFLSGIDSFLEKTQYLNAEIRIGIYYESSNILALSLTLNDDVIAALSRYRLSYTSTMYPS